MDLRKKYYIWLETQLQFVKTLLLPFSLLILREVKTKLIHHKAVS
jgi:hypothetical protein